MLNAVPFSEATCDNICETRVNGCCIYSGPVKQEEKSLDKRSSSPSLPRPLKG